MPTFKEIDRTVNILLDETGINKTRIKRSKQLLPKLKDRNNLVRCITHTSLHIHGSVLNYKEVLFKLIESVPDSSLNSVHELLEDIIYETFDGYGKSSFKLFNRVEPTTLAQEILNGYDIPIDLAINIIKYCMNLDYESNFIYADLGSKCKEYGYSLYDMALALGIKLPDFGTMRNRREYIIQQDSALEMYKEESKNVKRMEI